MAPCTRLSTSYVLFVLSAENRGWPWSAGPLLSLILFDCFLRASRVSETSGGRLSTISFSYNGKEECFFILVEVYENSWNSQYNNRS
jgi:hypothetical protein